MMLGMLAMGAALAAPADELAQSMAIPPSDIVSVDIDGSSGSYAVIPALGMLKPQEGSDAVYLYTGRIGKGPQKGTDQGKSGVSGDRVTFTVNLRAPEQASSFVFDFYFLSAEYPEYVGQQFNDKFEAQVSSSAWTGNAAIDSLGNMISVNSALFSVVDSSSLKGTGYDEGVGGGTGWLSMVVPVEPGEPVSIVFTIYDVADAIYDSGVLLDDFYWSEKEIETPSIVEESDVDQLPPKDIPPEEESHFDFEGPPLHVDLGELRESDRACQELPLGDAVNQVGDVPFELELVDSPPADHALELRIDGAVLKPGGEPIRVGPGAQWEVCLETGDRAPITTSTADEWLELKVSLDGQEPQVVPIQLSWHVEGLTPWERWRGLVYLLLGLLALAFIVYGYIRPSRFPRGLVIILSTEEDMEEGSRYGVSQHKGTGVGFYRDACVCIAADYRIMGDSRFSRARGAVVRLRAKGRLVAIQPVGGHTIEWRNSDEEWDPIPSDRESTVRFGEVYRLAGHGELYFEVRRG